MSEERAWLIVLGAHVQGRRLSRALYERTRCALAYLRAHPETRAVLSGGKGRGEDITEAEAMAEYLTARGIAPERLVLEKRSVNTKENLDYSLELIGDRHCPIGVVTNHFHLYRSCAIARKAGCTDVKGLAAPYRTWRLLWYVPREVLAYLKDRLKGNL